MTTTISKHYPGPCKLVVDALPQNIAGLAVGKVSWREGSTVMLHLYPCRTTAAAVFARPDQFSLFLPSHANTGVVTIRLSIFSRF